MQDNMDEQKIRQIAQQVYDASSAKDKFRVSPIAAHTHNNVDSLPVSFASITDKTVNYTFTIPGTSAATATNYSVFFMVPSTMSVSSISEAHTALGTDGNPVTLNIEKLTGTTAPGSGSNLLSTAFNLKGTINTIVSGQLVANPLIKNLAGGDRLAFVLTGTPTSVANVTVSITFSL